ncbi:hypothetical protein [Candidatus Poriferisodalis sp.]|uniref:hypothetical protein n=1 Tax=Candidatus Poriferisodalis sp. TaxID=3101277 RepID=UPI003D09BFB6
MSRLRRPDPHGTAQRAAPALVNQRSGLRFGALVAAMGSWIERGAAFTPFSGFG